MLWMSKKILIDWEGYILTSWLTLTAIVRYAHPVRVPPIVLHPLIKHTNGLLSGRVPKNQPHSVIFRVEGQGGFLVPN